MFIFDVEQRQDAQAVFQTIEAGLRDWEMMSFRMYRRDADMLQKLADHLLAKYQKDSGMIVKISDYKIVCFMRTFGGQNHAAAIRRIEKDLGGYEAQLSSERITIDKLKKFSELHLRQSAPHENEMYLERMQRDANKVLIIDDDLFVRKVIKSGFAPYAEVLDFDESPDILDNIKAFNPDIIFIDIHMPGRNGFEITETVIDFDPDAYIILGSSDASVDNVLKTLAFGASGFLAKPIRKNKLLEHAKRCITFKIEYDI